MKMYTAFSETGDFIEEIDSIEEGLLLIEKYEDEDRKEGAYTEGYYQIVDEDHCLVEFE